jgi:oxygen-independent coproporphyrinogen-3 oxidase
MDFPLTQQERRPLGLYFHIPFCPYRCHYCDFLSFTNQVEAIPIYVKALISDLQDFSTTLQNRAVVSVFFGGGTPSLLDPFHIEEILSCIKNYFYVFNDVEITLESNPGTLSFKKLKGYKKAGVNRLSLGIQALQDHHLMRMGRIHTAKEGLEAFFLARKAGFENINVDLIFGLPNQTAKEWEDTLCTVLSWKPDHLSAYGLQIEEGTPFSVDYKAGVLFLPDEEVQAEMYEKALLLAERSGLKQYEVSNFAKPGKECRHNLMYWKNEEYLGLGIGAVSYLDGKRFWMTRNLHKYLSREERIVGEEALPLEGCMGETLMLGLRLKSGVLEREFQKRFGVSLKEKYASQIAKFLNLGLLQWDKKEERLSLTQRGFLLANEIVAEFLN